MERAAKRACHSSHDDCDGPGGDGEDLRARRVKEWLLSLFKSGDDLRCQVSVKHSTSGGLGLFAAGDVRAGETLAVVPQSAAVTPTVVSSSEVGRALSKYPYRFRVITWLASAKQMPGHAFEAYLASLPAEPPNAPWWPKEVRLLLAGSNLGFACDAARNELEEFFTEAAAKHEALFSRLTLGDLQWAAGIYDSRRFPLRLGSPGSTGKKSTDDEGSATGEGIMIPLLDFGNHRHESTVQWQTNEKGDVLFHMKQDLVRGEEIFNQYGAKGNEELLMAYGFALESNPYESYSLVLSVGTAPPPAPQKKLGPFMLRLPGKKLEQFPCDLWRALADPAGFSPSVGSSNEQQSEIDPDDAGFLLATLQPRLAKMEALRSAAAAAAAAASVAAAVPVATERATWKESGCSAHGFVEWYYRGQVKVLQAATESLGFMLETRDDIPVE